MATSTRRSSAVLLWSDRVHAGNHLIQLLPARERTRLIRQFDPVDLVLSQALDEPGRTTKYVYFPLSGFVSLVALVDGQSAVEVGMVGREGMLGVHVGLGVKASPLRSLVQGPGLALRMTASKFRSELTRSLPLQRSMQRYVAVLMSQLATSAACARYHLIDERLARWLLMSQDRADADHFHLTHEFLSYMLGVRRVGVTTAAVALQREGLIAYHRGAVTVIDRKGLEARACSCYGSDRDEYEGMVR